MKAHVFPKGTGWEGTLFCSKDLDSRSFDDNYIPLGVVHLKEQQDQDLPPEEHYIRRIIDLQHDEVVQHDEDELTDASGTLDSLRVIVCMTKEASQRLLSAQYLQSDIGFKRVVGFHEFEIACLDRITNTSEFPLATDSLQTQISLYFCKALSSAVCF
jgi:hypothetical protein